jgi:hypothetical protein
MHAASKKERDPDKAAHRHVDIAPGLSKYFWAQHQHIDRHKHLDLHREQLLGKIEYETEQKNRRRRHWNREGGKDKRRKAVFAVKPHVRKEWQDNVHHVVHQM